MTTPAPSAPRQGARPLSTPVALLAGAAVLAVTAVLFRFWHGSWARVAAASLAPAMFGFGLLALWAIERRRGRALLPRLGTILLVAALGALAGASASAMASTLGPAWAGAMTGLLYGTLIGVAWARRPLPGPVEPAAKDEAGEGSAKGGGTAAL